MSRRSALVALSVLSLAVGISGAQGSDSGSVAARVSSSPLQVALALSTTRIGVGEKARASAIVTNGGAETVHEVTVELRGDPDGLTLTGRNPRRFSALGPADAAGAAWLVCGRGPATYVLVAQARASLPDGASVSAESDARLLTISGPPACR